jgi:hypothetical protein
MSEFKIGDKVRIKDSKFLKREYQTQLAYAIYEGIKLEGTVVDIHEFSNGKNTIRLDSGCYYWSEDSLERIDEMELKDTVEMMLSSDYKERFKAEYYQLKIRHDKLQKMVHNWNRLDFTPTCTYTTYLDQLLTMEEYMSFLIYRAKLEEVELDDEEIKENRNGN